MYHITGARITFSWPENTGYRENFQDLTEGLRAAANYSIEQQTQIRVIIPGYEEMGMVEGRVNSARRMPEKRAVVETFNVASISPYIVVHAPVQGVYYTMELPGLCQQMDYDILAVSPEFGDLRNGLYNEIFNCIVSQGTLVAPDSRVQNYLNSRRTLAVLTKKPKTVKTVDFMPIFVALFGEKIATVIMKEIK